MPKISVIVPVYKVENYLRECINSLMNQTFKDIEIILVDDGSPDCCGEICDVLAKEDDRICVIHQKNQGLSCARNAGIQRASGKYLCFLDSDDLVLPTYCEILYNLLNETPYDFSFCGVARFRDGETPPNTDVNGHPVVVNNIEYLRMQLERKTEFGVWNKLFRREVFNQISFAPQRLNEDVLFSADILEKLNHGAIGTPKQLYLYRQREGSIVSNQAIYGSSDFIYAASYLLNSVIQYAPELTKTALHYAGDYPWMFVDRIYVRGEFARNRVFLQTLQIFLRKNIKQYEELEIFSRTKTHRMKMFSTSKILYAFNAYARLFRVYLFRLIGKDAYKNGHGI